MWCVMAGLYSTWCRLLFMSSLLGLILCAGRPFQHDFQATDEDGFQRYRVQSNGTRVHVIDLDDTSVVMKFKCDGDRIMVVLTDMSLGQHWTTGDIVVGIPRDGCTFHHPHINGIYRKVKHIYFIKDSRYEITTELARPHDMFDVAEIRLHRRSKRSDSSTKIVSTFLNPVMDNIHWDKEISETVLINPRRTKYGIEKVASQSSVQELSRDTRFPGDLQFRFMCTECYGQMNTDYNIHLKLDRSKTGDVKTYHSQLEGNIQYSFKFYIKATKSLTLSHFMKIPDTSPVSVVTMPVSDDLNIVFQVHTETYLTVNATVHGPVYENVRVKTDGTYAISETFGGGVESSGKNWTVASPAEVIIQNDHTFNITATITSKMFFTSKIGYSKKPVNMSFSAPFSLELKHDIKSLSAVDQPKICTTSDISVNAKFHADDTTYDVEAFHLQLWNIFLANKYDKVDNLMTSGIYSHCVANCPYSKSLRNQERLEETCGNPTTAIVRDSDEYNSLQEIFGSLIRISSTDNEESTWCGSEGKACADCNEAKEDDICSDRLVTSNMAIALTKLGKFVRAEWNNGTLIILDAWNEPTSKYPKGKFGNASLFYEGRAATVGLSFSGVDLTKRAVLDTEESKIHRLKQLATCAGLSMVDNSAQSGTLHVCSESLGTVNRRKKRSTNTKDKISQIQKAFDSLLNDVQSEVIKFGKDIWGKMKDFFSGGKTSYPHDKNPLEVLGDIDGWYSMDNQEVMSRLVLFCEDGVEFEAEGSSKQTCGMETRRCRSSNACQGVVDPLKRPIERLMTTRLNFRLHRFFSAVKQANGPCPSSFFYCDSMCLPDHWKGDGEIDCQDESDEENSAGRRKRSIHSVQKNALEISGDDGYENKGDRRRRSVSLPDWIKRLKNNGRALRINISPDSSYTSHTLANLAVHAGFDYVSYGENHVDVGVRIQAGLKAKITLFPKTNLIAVDPPRNETGEYAVPDSENSYPLFDGHDSSLSLSGCYKIADVQSPGKRYFRFDTTLLECLEEAATDYGSCLRIIKGSAYRTSSLNEENIEERHTEERSNFLLGKAVELTGDDLERLGTSLIRSCTAILRPRLLKIGLGCHKDRLYMDIRTTTSPTDIIDMWNVNNADIYKTFTDVKQTITEGGPFIDVRNSGRYCEEPPLGEAAFYYKTSSGICILSNSEFCKETKSHRTRAATDLAKEVSKAAGSDTQLPLSRIRPEVNACFLDTCGGCLGRGEIWKKKQQVCLKLIKSYIDAATDPFSGSLNNNAAFFNMGKQESHVHSLACHDGSVCLEKTQIYSLFISTLQSRYRPDPTTSVEEMLYAPADNPLPVLDMLEHEMAMTASGKVKVYIEDKSDMSALYDIIKILMVYNKKVTLVEYHLVQSVDKNWFISSLNKKTERWSTSVCPKRSRLAVTPYDIITISEDRRKRSLDRSKSRNENKLKMRNWEMEWILST